MFAWILAIVVLLAVFAYVGWRLYRSNMDPVTIANAEKRLGPKAALQFALDNGLPLKTAAGETDGFNAWNVGDAGGFRVTCAGDQ